MIKPLDNIENISEGGIIIAAPTLNRKAIVLSVGKNTEVKKGDIVLRNLGKSTPHTIGDHKIEIIHINNLIAIVGNINDENG